MRIGIEASTWVTPRGYGRFTRELTRALVEQNSGHHVELVVDSGAAKAADLPDVARTVVPTGRAVTEAASAGRSRSLGDMRRMSRALAARRFDWVLFPTSYSYVPVMTHARIALVVHDALPEMLPSLVLGSRLARLLWWTKMRLACAQATLLATVSNASAERLRQYLPVGRRPIVVLTEGTAPVFSSIGHAADGDALRSFNLERGRYVLYVGGLSPHKRVPALIDAFVQVCAASPVRTLVLAGPTHEDSFHTEAGAVASAIGRAAQAEAAIVQTGFVPDEVLAALYRHARCLVLPSMEEGFGLPALEAMTCGCAVLASRTPALVEVCGDAAEYVDRIEELPASLGRLLHDDHRRDEMIQLGRERSLQFGWPVAARRLLTALESAT